VQKPIFWQRSKAANLISMGAKVPLGLSMDPFFGNRARYLAPNLGDREKGC
jgi:hypothetical protein